MTTTVAERRVKKELQKLRKDPLDGMTVEVGEVPTEWFVTIIGKPMVCLVDCVVLAETLHIFSISRGSSPS